MMKPIYEFQVIQVELTNACIHQCSNCTRFCGHHKKPFFMEWNTFKKSIDTLDDWPRCVGIMGGEPTLHPEFNRFAQYANEKHPMQYDIGGGHKPISSLSKYIIDANGIKTGPLNKFRGLGLWSSVCDKYYEHYELIQDSFSFQCINDHTASSRHQAWLMTRKEFGISDEDWTEMRDNCWWQRLLGSPSITPKGAFFCEVAAAMDMLFNGPGGWKVEKGWWERGPEDYKDQLHWCELCSGAIHSFDRDANEAVDDVSPLMYEKLRKVGSPKLNRPGALCVHPMGKDCDIEIKPRKNMLLYQPNNELRFTDKNSCLFPKKIFAVTFINEINNNTKQVVNANARLFDEFIIITKEDAVKEALSQDFKVIKNESLANMNCLATTLRKENDWIAVIKPDVEIDTDLREKINKTIFNPGTFHIFKNCGMMFFNAKATAYRNAGFDGISSLTEPSELSLLWQKEKVVVLNNGFENAVSPDIIEWKNTITRKGIMHWNYLQGVMNDMELRRVVMPQIDAIICSDYTLAKKLASFDDIELTEMSDEVLCNKIKTTIHNELGKAFSTMDILQIKKKLLLASNSFCAQYALAMLTVGEEKKMHLINCVLNKKNTYYLGLATLKAHCDTYDRKIPKYPQQSKGIVEEIVESARNSKPLVIVGNKYVGKSIEMILSKANLKPVCFADEYRQGFDFDGLPTLNFDDAVKLYSSNSYLISEPGDAGDGNQLMMERKGYDQNFLHLHPLTIVEMSMTPVSENLGIFTHELNILKQLGSSCDSLREQLRNILLVYPGGKK